MTDLFLPDLASRELGGGVVAANDELFAQRENLIKPEAPVFQPHTFGPKGQIMDGWETRRRRERGPDSHDFAIVRLGCPGVVRTVVIDTAFFRGNFPSEASVEACGADGHPSPDELAAADWTTLVARCSLSGDNTHDFMVDDRHRYTHVRLSIYPDGGVARLRIFGKSVPDPRLLPHTIDLAALEAGGRVLECSNSFFSSPNNLIKPGLAREMGDGWETARRRDAGNDWVRLQLACSGRVAVAEIDTTHFVGNAPGWASLTGGDVTLLPRTALQPDTRHRFAVHADEVSEVRLDVFPDGGVGRLRLFGTPTEAGRAHLALQFVNALPDSQFAELLVAAGPFNHAPPGNGSDRPYADLAAIPDALQNRLAGAGA
jgi:allantoicase